MTGEFSHEFDDEQTMVVGGTEMVCVVSEIEAVEADVARDTIKSEWRPKNQHARHFGWRSHRKDDDDDDD